MGDETWTGLYPNSFIKSFPYDSFDVWDLHTLDDAVIGHLYPELDHTYGT
jgi:phosphatidylinositol glycan class O